MQSLSVFNALFLFFGGVIFLFWWSFRFVHSYCKLFDVQLGFFNETLPLAAKEGHLTKLALLRLDCDMYQSTMDVLEAAYHRLSPGGILIHNNWQYTAARAAAVDFRRKLGIEKTHPVHLIDMGSAYWVA